MLERRYIYTFRTSIRTKSMSLLIKTIFKMVEYVTFKAEGENLFY